MVENSHDNSSDKTKPVPAGSNDQSQDSLFNRTNSDVSKTVPDKASGKDNTLSAFSSDDHKVDSLYDSVMGDIKSGLHKVGEKVGYYKPEAQSDSKVTTADDKILGSVILTGDTKGAAKNGADHVSKTVDKVSTDQTAPKVTTKEYDDTKKVLSAIAQSASDTSTAAYITVANKLADDHTLRKMVTDSSGHITESSINGAMMRDAGLNVHSEREGIPGPQVMDDSQREALNTVRTHWAGAVKEAGKEITGISAVQTLAEKGLSETSLKGMSTAEIAKTLVDKGFDFSKTSTAALQDAIKSVVTSDKVNGTTNGHKAEQQEAGGEIAPHARSGSTSTEVPKGQFDNPAGPKPPENLQQLPQFSAEDIKRLTDAVNKQQAMEQHQAVEEQPPTRETVPQLSNAEFASVAKQVLAKIDANHTGAVTKEQLAKAIEDPQFKGKEAQALAAMYQNFDSMHNLSNHEGWFGGKSITAGDLDKFNEIQAKEQQRVNDAFAMKAWSNTSLSKYDHGSGSLTKDDIAAALKDPKTPPDDRKMLETIQKHYSEMGHFWESGVNKQAFEDYAKNIFKDTSDAKLNSGVYASTWSVEQGQTSDISHDLYGDKNNPLNSIKPDAIKQGSIGDCYFESSLAAVAKSNPEAIKNMIKDNGNGTYTVTFPGAKDEPITIKAPTEAEQGLYNHGSPNGLWASVVEKAYGEYCQKHFYRRNLITNPFGGSTPTEGSDGGGRTSGVMQLLTGHDTSTNFLLVTSQSTVASNLEKAFSSHPPKAVTAGINGSLIGADQTADKFYTGHAYTITGFVPDGKGGGMVTIRNPWGGADGTTNGTITVPLDKFISNFSDITYEQ